MGFHDGGIRAVRVGISVITSPSVAFSEIAERAIVLPVYLMHMAAAWIALSVLASEPTSGAQAPLLEFPGTQQVLRSVDIVTRVLAIAIWPWLSGIAVASLAMILGLVLPGAASFRTYLSMAGLARLPLYIGELVYSFTVLLARLMGKNDIPGLNLAVFLPDAARPEVKAVLATLDPFVLWYYWLLVLGSAAVHRVPLSKALSISLILYGANLFAVVVIAPLGA